MQLDFDLLRCEVRQCSYFPTVSDLLGGCTPGTIGWLVVPVNVGAVKGERSIRAWPHVIVEGLEGVEPSFTHRDASASVVLKTTIFWVGASGYHVTPNAVLWDITQPVSGVSVTRNFASAATATSRGPLTEGFPANNFCGSTVALTAPVHFAISCARGFKDHKSPEPPVCHVNDAHEEIIGGRMWL